MSPTQISIENNGASVKITENNVPRFVLKYQIREVDIIRGNTLKIDISRGPLNNIYIDRDNVTSPVTATIEELRDFILDMLQSSISGTATEAKQDEEIAQIITLQNILNTLQGKINVSATEAKQDSEIAQIVVLQNLISALQNKVNTTATEAKQNEEIAQIVNLQTLIGNLQAKLNTAATEAKQNEEIAQIIALQNIMSNLQINGGSSDNLFYQPLRVDETDDNIVYNGFAEPGANEEAPVWAIQKVSKVDGIYYYHWASGNKNFDKVWMNRKALAYR